MNPERAGASGQALQGAGSGLIDAHVHIMPPEIVRDRSALLQRDEWFRLLYADPRARLVDAEGLLAEMDACGVATAVVFGFPFADPGLCRMVNDYVAEAVNAHPGRLAGLACVSPERPGAVAEAARCLDAGFVGCGELVLRSRELDGGWHELASFLAERGSRLLLHANEPVGHVYPGKGRFPLEVCAAYVAAHPDLTLVLGHMGGGILFYELMPEVRHAFANVYYDTAAVPYLYDARLYTTAVLCAGPEKIIFGSDYPLLSPSRYFDQMKELSPEARAAVLGNNARKVFGL
jgi:predicted TIM-barrel fold metal-dependent hydrolase